MSELAAILERYIRNCTLHVLLNVFERNVRLIIDPVLLSNC